MPSVFTHEFNNDSFKGKSSFETGLFINGQFVDGSDNTCIEYVSSKETVYYWLLIG
jgi:aldehyde dehydrogenase (NAD+)